MALLKKPSPNTLGGGALIPAIAPMGKKASSIPSVTGEQRGRGFAGTAAPSFDTTYGSAFAGRQFKNPTTATPTGVATPGTTNVAATNAALPMDTSEGRRKGIYGKPGR